MRIRSIVSALLLALLASARVDAQPAAGFCGIAETPHFDAVLAELADELGDVMGEPVECAHANPDNGDLLQRTTTGLAYYRAALEIPVFTDGAEHWALTDTGIDDWTSIDVDPPGVTTPAATRPPEAADWAAALAAAPVSRAVPGALGIDAFPAPLRVPRIASELFAGLSVREASAWKGTDTPSTWSYSVALGTGPNDAPLAQLFGSAGRTAFARAAEPADGCRPAAGDDYCASSSAGSLERFFGLAVAGQPTVATHVARGSAQLAAWRVEWYEPSVDVSYGFSLAEAAGRLPPEAAALDRSNGLYAQDLTDAAELFLSVRVPGPRAASAPLP
ncbi:MAG: hypothetical protein JO352_17860 [Chloroflexi bacterium]|nr:hypothetical protein [Chloroflexota bacterium]MBV9599190.1 hypothetical protein [Chloroflexota bacterium]